MVRQFFFIIGILLLVSGCTISDKFKADEIYNQLKDDQAKIILHIKGSNFYKEESIFHGHLEIVEKSFTINYFDQFDSNVMIHFGADKWYEEKPIKAPIRMFNSYTSTVMFGKIKDKAKRRGEGYLMSQGLLTFKSLNKDKIVIEVVGKAKKYPNVGETDPAFEVEGIIVCKKPKIAFLDVNEANTLY